MFAVEQLGPADIHGCETLSAEAGWNQTADDWSFLLTRGEVFGIRADGRVIASAAAMPYPPAASWICMVLVTAAERRKGHASCLLAHCRARNAELGLVSGLDATPAGRSVYLGLGFRDALSVMRIRAARIGPAAAASASVVPAGPADLDAILDYDRKAFGADRGALLRHLLARMPAIAQVVRDGGRLAGFVLGRDGRTATQIGPLVADDEAIAIHLAEAALGRVPDRPVVIDVPLHQSRLRGWLARIGFAEERPFTRMLDADAPLPGDLARLMAITGPEFS